LDWYLLMTLPTPSTVNICYGPCGSSIRCRYLHQKDVGGYSAAISGLHAKPQHS
jgi:hypothetical protein